MRADEKLSVVGEMEIDGAFEFDCSDQIFVVAAYQYLGFTRVGGSFVDSALEGSSVERLAVSGRAIFQYIEYLDVGARRLKSEPA